MAKNKNVQKHSQKPGKNGAHMKGNQKPALEVQEDEYEASEQEATTEEPEGVVDQEAAVRLFKEAFAADKEIERANKVVEEKKAALSVIILQLRKAVGGKSGPFMVDGQRVILREKNGHGFWIREQQQNHMSFNLSE